MSFWTVHRKVKGRRAGIKKRHSAQQSLRQNSTSHYEIIWSICSTCFLTQKQENAGHSFASSSCAPVSTIWLYRPPQASYIHVVTPPEHHECFPPTECLLLSKTIVNISRNETTNILGRAKRNKASMHSTSVFVYTAALGIYGPKLCVAAATVS